MKTFRRWSAWMISTCAVLWLLGYAWTAQAGPRVAGFDELVVYPPGMMDRDLPGIDLVKNEEFGWQADVQPTLHVHRNFYNGDKEFQGPLLQGGPTIVSACHPRTGKRLYAQVNLPSGAPIIVYGEDSITYVYQDQRAVLTFCGHAGGEEVIMTLKHGRGLCRVKHEHHAELVKKHKTFSDRFPLKRSIHDAAKSVGTTVKGAAGTATTATSAAVTRVKETVSGLPGIQQLQSAGKEAGSQGNIESLKQAAGKAQDTATEYEKTIR